MNQTVFLVLGLVAALVTVAVVWGGRRNQLTSESGIIGGLFGIGLWGIWVMNAYSVEYVTQTGETVVRQYQSLAVMGLAATGLCLFATVQAIIVQLNKEEY